MTVIGVLFKAASSAITSVLTAVISPKAAAYGRLNGWLMVIYCPVSALWSWLVRPWLELVAIFQ